MSGDQSKTAAYYSLLKEVVRDLVIDDDELLEVKNKRIELQLSTEQIRAMHAKIFAVAIGQFVKDEFLDESEASKLDRLYGCLVRLGWAPGHNLAFQNMAKTTITPSPVVEPSKKKEKLKSGPERLIEKQIDAFFSACDPLVKLSDRYFSGDIVTQDDISEHTEDAIRILGILETSSNIPRDIIAEFALSIYCYMAATVFARFKEWQKQPQHKNAIPTAPDMYNYNNLLESPISAMLVQERHDKNHIVERFRGKPFFPVDKNLEITLQEGKDYYESGKEQLMEMLSGE